MFIVAWKLCLSEKIILPVKIVKSLFIQTVSVNYQDRHDNTSFATVKRSYNEFIRVRRWLTDKNHKGTKILYVYSEL